MFVIMSAIENSGCRMMSNHASAANAVDESSALPLSAHTRHGNMGNHNKELRK